MARGLDRTAFLSESTRLRIAELCREEALTLEEIAAEMGRPSGSLSQPRTMLKHGALVEDKRRRKRADGRGRAKAFRLNRRWWPHLEEARRRQRPAWAATRQELLLIPVHETHAACVAIKAGVPEIEWGARLGGERFRLILAPESDTDGASTIRVIQALGVVDVIRLQVDDVKSPSELRDWSARVIRGRDPIGELSSNS